MRDAHTITLEKLIVHILDNSASSPDPVLSNHECEITDDIAKFFAAHIEQSISEDRARVAKFKRPDARVKACCDEIFNRSNRFIPNSKQLAQGLFIPMRLTRRISPGDLAVCLYSAGNLTGKFIAMFKMDFMSAFRHSVKGPEDDRTIQLVAQKNLLPSPQQRVQKCVFIRPSQPDQFDMVILDNQISSINEATGAANFFSKTFLEAELWLTDMERTRLFRSLTTEWVAERYKDLPPEQADAITSTARSAILSDSVNVRNFAEVTIPDASLRVDYLQHLRQNRLEDVEFSPDHTFAEKVTKRKKYRAEGGLIVSGDAADFDELVKVDYERDAQNRITVTIKTTRWIEEAK